MVTSELTAIADDLYCLDSSFTVWGCAGSVRMSVIRTRDGVVIYSPVAMKADHIAQIRELGFVHTIIAPNLYHHMFLRAASSAFPNARVLIPNGLEAKIGPIPATKTIAERGGFELPAGLQYHVFSGHSLRETVLYHDASGTLITADLIYNCQIEQFAAEKAFFRLMGLYGRPGVPFYHRFAIDDKAAVGSLIDKVRTWQVRRIVPCHGRIIERDDAGEMFAQVWQRFA